MTRCIHAHQRQRMVLYHLGYHLEPIPGQWDCGLAEMKFPDCDGTKDPGCGRYECVHET